MDPAEREREAEVAVRELRRKGTSRDGIFEDLVRRGLTPDEADDVLDGRGLPAGDGRRVFRSGTPATTDLSPEISALASGPVGIGGWLLLPAIGLFVGAFRLYQSAQEVRKTLASDDLPHVEPQYPGITSAVRLELAANLGLLALTVVAAFFFFRKSRLAPWIMIALLAAQALVGIADEMYIASLLQRKIDAGLVFGALSGGVLWILYFLHSARVKNTFVR